MTGWAVAVDVAPDERVAGEGESAFAAMLTLPDLNGPIAGGAALGSLPVAALGSLPVAALGSLPVAALGRDRRGRQNSWAVSTPDSSTVATRRARFSF
jgi:hypothetical protein